MRNGNRVPNFVLGNIQNGQYKYLFNKSREITKKLLLDVLQFVIWPGGSKNLPQSTPKCGFNGELCKKELNHSNDNGRIINFS